MAENEKRKGSTLCGGIIAQLIAGLGYMVVYKIVREMVRSGSKSGGVVGKCVFIVTIIIGWGLLVYTAKAFSMLFSGALDLWKTRTSLPENTKIQLDAISLPPLPPKS